MANLPYTLTHTDQIRPDQTRPSWRGKARRQSLNQVLRLSGRIWANMVKFQLGVSKAFTAVGRTYTVRIHNNHREVCPIYMRPSVCPPAGDTQRLLTCWQAVHDAEVLNFSQPTALKFSRRKLRAEFDRLRTDPMSHMANGPKINF